MCISQSALSHARDPSVRGLRLYRRNESGFQRDPLLLSLPGSMARQEILLNVDNRRIKSAATFVPALLVFVAYLPTLGNGFVWDDRILLRDQPALNDSSLWVSALAHFLRSISFNYFRPVAVVTFLAEGQIWGFNPAGFHFTNILLHALNTLLVTALAQELLARSKEQRQHPLLGALLGLAYGLHPALVESVAFTSSRFDLLMTTWVLVALLVDTRFKQNSRRLVAIATLFFVAALTKETAMVLPVVLLLWRFAIAERGTRENTLPTVSALAVGGVAYLAVRGFTLGYLYRPSAPRALPTGDALQHALLIGRSALEYAHLCFFPFTALSPIHTTPLPIPTDNLAAWAGVLCLLLLVGGLFVACRRLPRAAALVGAGLVALLPALNILPLELSGSMFAAERYLTLPLAFFVLALVAWIPQPAGLRRVWQLAVCLWLVACVVTVERTLPHWRTELSLWTWAAERVPTSALPHTNLSNYYIDHGDNARVLAEADAALQRDSDDPQAWNNRGVALFNMERFADAQEAWERATRLAPEYALSWVNLSNALGVQGRLEEAEQMVNRALQLKPDLGLAHLTLGELYLATDRSELAIEQFEHALKLLPTDRQKDARESLARARQTQR